LFASQTATATRTASLMKKRIPRHMPSALPAAQAVERNPAQGVQVVLRLQTDFGAVAPVRHRIGRRPLQLVQLRDSSRQVAPFQTPLRPCKDGLRSITL